MDGLGCTIEVGGYDGGAFRQSIRLERFWDLFWHNGWGVIFDGSFDRWFGLPVDSPWGRCPTSELCCEVRPFLAEATLAAACTALALT